MSAAQFPIRCVTCSKVINSYWKAYKERTDSGEDYAKVLDDLKIGRMCCRRMFMTHVDIEHYQLLYPTYKDNIQRMECVANRKPKNFGNDSDDE